jgi:hypothetical protein
VARNPLFTGNRQAAREDRILRGRLREVVGYLISKQGAGVDRALFSPPWKW